MNITNKIFDLYQECRLCPRNCRVNRTQHTGFCRESSHLSINKILLHGGEEPCISIGKGSGTIFFTGCSLQCVFCQNMEISQQQKDKSYYSADDLVAAIEQLIENGAENINFVTPDHFMPHILYAADQIRKKGYKLPLIYNCSGYQSIEQLELIVDLIDIFLIDYKFSLSEVAKLSLQSNQPDYPSISLKAIEYLYRKKGNLQLDLNGKAIQGVLIRHLVLPGELFIANSRDVVNEIFFQFGNTPYLTLMAQYTPIFLKDKTHPLFRRLTEPEYNEVVSLARELGFNNLYTQEIPDETDHYIPDFAAKKMYDRW